MLKSLENVQEKIIEIEENSIQKLNLSDLFNRSVAKHVKINLRRNSNLEVFFNLKTGSDLLNLKNINIDINLLEPGAQITLRCALVLNNNDFEINIFQNHISPNTESHIDVRSVSDNGSNFKFNGKIFISEFAKNSNASLINKNIAIDDNSNISSIPVLEILNKDVKCSHGSAVGKLDPNSIYYLMAKGLSLDKAKTLLIEAFLK